jgi:hypothetical protein
VSKALTTSLRLRIKTQYIVEALTAPAMQDKEDLLLHLCVLDTLRQDPRTLPAGDMSEELLLEVLTRMRRLAEKTEIVRNVYSGIVRKENSNFPKEYITNVNSVLSERLRVLSQVESIAENFELGNQDVKSASLALVLGRYAFKAPFLDSLIVQAEYLICE